MNRLLDKPVDRITFYMPLRLDLTSWLPDPDQLESNYFTIYSSSLLFVFNLLAA